MIPTVPFLSDSDAWREEDFHTGPTATGVSISVAGLVDLRWGIVLKCSGVFSPHAFDKLSDWRGHPFFYLTPSRSPTCVDAWL